jgi:hypothetical protein
VRLGCLQTLAVRKVDMYSTYAAIVQPHIHTLVYMHMASMHCLVEENAFINRPGEQPCKERHFMCTR